MSLQSSYSVTAGKPRIGCQSAFQLMGVFSTYNTQRRMHEASSKSSYLYSNSLAIHVLKAKLTATATEVSKVIYHAFILTPSFPLVRHLDATQLTEKVHVRFCEADVSLIDLISDTRPQGH